MKPVFTAQGHVQRGNFHKMQMMCVSLLLRCVYSGEDLFVSMSIGASLSPAAFPPALDAYFWSDSCSTVCVSSFTHSNSRTWTSSLCLSKLSVRMEQNKPEKQADLSSEFQPQLDLFRKLGFSEAQIRGVLLKLGLHTDTNRILGELIQVRAAETEGSPGPPALAPHAQSVSSPPAAEHEDPAAAQDEDALRPIVIDGSNVAMR